MGEHDINEITERLARLEEQWKAHGDSSMDFRKDIKEMLKLNQSDHNDIKKIMNGNGKPGLCAKVDILWTRYKFLVAAVLGTILKLLFDTFTKKGG